MFVSAQVGWEDGDWVFSCMDYSTLMDDLNDPAGNCTLSASGERQHIWALLQSIMLQLAQT